MNILRQMQSPSQSPPVKRESSIANHKHLKSQIPSHANRSLHGVIRNHTHNHNLLMRTLPQHRLQFRPDKRTVRMLGHHGLARHRQRALFEIAPRLPRPVLRLRLARMMLHMYHPALRLPPHLQQPGNVFLGLRIITAAPTGVIDRLLNVNNEERCGIREHINIIRRNT